ncbi:sporulation protein [Staphylococcus hyicus]|uniref:sporulation protein n=1 Tax=Staphylococcus hyicus TaxID=1284 RepID=UPI00208E031B|nr:sporulation protein [Staphylococcus hyicus]MCO4328382.1 sporulation protein [Staphylococcus hyicus]MCO4331179.1 sporulation protein [Staphylococcus hyicus]MCO4334157.1 sporulation protein [Staphylococcus hyicus]MCO4336067.1 sporulation protein [Staphylococcus hyicus]
MGFENILTSLGINGMHVYIRLDQNEYQLSDVISGCIHFKAGDSAQTVTHTEVKLIEKYENNDETSEFSQLENELDTFTLENSFTVEKGKPQKVTFNFKPENLNFQSEESKVYLKAHVYIDLGVDEEVEEIIPYINH